METKKWWVVTAKHDRVFLGRVYETETALRSALGPYIAVVGNHVDVWGKPSRVGA